MSTIKQSVIVIVFVFVATALLSCGSKENDKPDDYPQEHKTDNTNGSWW